MSTARTRESSGTPHQPIYELADGAIAIEHVAANRETQAHGRAALIAPDGSRLPLTPEAYDILARVNEGIERGRAVRVITREKELTTQDAADILSISRQYLIRLLERGEIPFTKAGTHRRLRLQDVLAYRQRRSEDRRQSLARLTRRSQELGDY
jgi:excisionase family DNA binding protein